MTKVLNWVTELKKLDELSEHIIWTHGAYIWFVILLSGIISFFHPQELLNGSKIGFYYELVYLSFLGSQIHYSTFLF